MPFERAKPSAALVGLPSAPMATLVYGPNFSILLSLPWASKPSRRSAKRRGAANNLLPVNAISLAFRCASIPAWNAAAKFFNAFGGNSSVPISTKKSCLTIFESVITWLPFSWHLLRLFWLLHRPRLFLLQPHWRWLHREGQQEPEGT